MSVREYIGARYVPLFAEPIMWDATRTYEPLTVVLYQGNSYTSRQAVPANIDITNTTYWAQTGNYNAQVEQYRQEVQTFDGRITNNANAISQEAQNRISADTLLGNRIDDIEAVMMFASYLGFSSDVSDAQSNYELYASLNNIVVYCDIDIPFSSQISFTKNKYIVGNHKLIYTGELSSGFFVTMEPTSNSEVYALYGASIECTIECNNKINGFSWHGGISTTVSLTVLNPNYLGIQIEHNDTSVYKPSYGNTYKLFVHKNQHVLGTTGVNIYAADDVYESIETGNFQNSVNVYTGNIYIAFAHPWVANDTLYQNSSGIIIPNTYTGGTVSIGTIFCDVVKEAIKINAACVVQVNFLYNFWNAGFATNYTGKDVPFVINAACRLQIDTLYWKYKSGSLDQTTGLSNTRIKILENYRYVSISKLMGLVFVGDLSNSPECCFSLAPTANYSEKYTNVPAGFNTAADSYSIEIVRASNEISDSFAILNTKYKLMANRDSQWFIAQSNAGANISWYSVNMQSAS